MTLTPKASLLVWLWWSVLHVLLVAAALLVGWPWLLKCAAIVGLMAHAAVRRPRPGPATVLVGADASCAVPEWGISPAALGLRTVASSYWIRLDVGIGPLQRDILLLIDQLDPDQWARLNALLERARCDTAHVSRRSREPI